jgi:Holliday junction resolvasome RuvABC endonuclease subunit
VCGLAGIEVGPRGGISVLHAEAFHPPVGDGSDKQHRFQRAASLAVFGARIDALQWQYAFDAFVFEQVAMAQNTNTVRLLAYYESMVMHVAGTYGLECWAINATMARRLVLGKGGLAKAELREPFMELYGGHYAWPEDKGGDVVDAAVLALSLRPFLAERDAAKS